MPFPFTQTGKCTLPDSLCHNLERRLTLYRFLAGKTRTKDKYRVVYTETQRVELEKEFHFSRYITIKRKSELAHQLNLSERQVRTPDRQRDRLVCQGGGLHQMNQLVLLLTIGYWQWQHTVQCYATDKANTLAHRASRSQCDRVTFPRGSTEECKEEWSPVTVSRWRRRQLL